ncbi:ubiquinone/menaquinone biosynthesis methyltransferase family protein (macronuclear) [Tetrahymena thermophila SB210]|uniref:Ubiquinone/menaquinone biosynthesis methyltransferase family protein n=1 Tax=Tetrahymena thermophila (strain SB210) TaxID=312017 RepID=I7M8P3_TETTS|nr:ubiquinone/menaquinone biosynthesis methyltransferase family protein [Tetrahymena thermophila SB210]EAR99401.2 ubiquinone/menaquinone biosynthesis methyltransferase family protein [Tetrahymena thermophila SB210]|eukprot:XP_001019646.2 ubiquinone/menaquinone biosynthesis methyltransferase family protein [Tetrahymena thermophila SB210]
MSQANIQHETHNVQNNEHDHAHIQDPQNSQNIQGQTHHDQIKEQNVQHQNDEQSSNKIIQDGSAHHENKGVQSISVISGAEQEEQEDYLKQNSIQYFDEKEQHLNNQPLTERSQNQNSEQIHKEKEQTSPPSNNDNDHESAEKKVEQDNQMHLSGHVLSQQEREFIIKQNNHNNNNGKAVISGKKNIKEGQSSLVTPKKRLSIQRLSAQKNLNSEDSTEKQLYSMNDASEITKSNNQIEKNEQNQELVKLRLQNDKLREELKSLSDKLSIVIEKNQKNIASSKNRLNNQTSDPVLKQELNNAYKLIDAIQRDNKKLQSQVYEGGHYEKVMKLENDLKSKDQEIKLIKRELELTKKLQKIAASQESDKKDIQIRKEDFNEKYVLKQKIKELQDKLSEQEDKFNKQYKEFLSMEKEYKKLCEKNNIKPNFIFNEQENAFERQSKPSQIQLVSRDRKSGSLANNPRRSESLKPLDKSKLVQNNSVVDQIGAAGLANDPEFSNLEFNEQNFQEILQKARVYKKSKISNEKKLNNEINELKNILGQKNQEILALKQQLLNRDRQSNNLQSQINQLKRQKQNLNEQQNYNQPQMVDNNISIDENDGYDNNYIPGADQTNNSIQYATPMKEERQIPKKKLLPQNSNLKNKSKSPLQKQIVTQPDSQTSRNLISNPSTNLPFSTSNNSSPVKKSAKKQIQLNPINHINNPQPQYSSYEPNINSNNNRYPQQKKTTPTQPKQQQHSLQEIPNHNIKKQTNQKQLQQQPRQSDQQLSKKSDINQSVEEFNSYSPTRFQNDEKNMPVQNNVLLSEQNLNMDDIISHHKGISPQQQVLIPLTLRDVQIGAEVGDSYKFTDRITLKQNYHHKIVLVKVAHDEKGIIGIQCFYRLQKTSQIVEGEMHIIKDQNSNIILDDEQYITEEFNADDKQDGDYIKYVQGTLNTETSQIVNLIFVSAKGYRKLLGLQQQNNYENLQSFNLEISENEVPICLYGSLQKQYGDNENPTGSILTMIGFNVERDDNQIEENIKAFYTEDDQVRTEFELNQKQQEMKKKKNNNSTKFIRDENHQQENNQQFSQNNSQLNIQHIQQKENQDNHHNHIESNQDHANQKQNNSYESPYFKSEDKRDQQVDHINPIQIVNQADHHEKNEQINQKQHNSEAISQQQFKLDANQQNSVQNDEEDNEFTLSNMNVQNDDKKDKLDSHGQDLLLKSPQNHSSQHPSRNSQYQTQQIQGHSKDIQKAQESISRNSNSHKESEIIDKKNNQNEHKKENQASQKSSSPQIDQTVHHDSDISRNKQQPSSQNDQHVPSSLSQRNNEGQNNEPNQKEIKDKHQEELVQQKTQVNQQNQKSEHNHEILNRDESKNEFIEPQNIAENLKMHEKIDKPDEKQKKQINKEQDNHHPQNPIDPTHLSHNDNNNHQKQNDQDHQEHNNHNHQEHYDHNHQNDKHNQNTKLENKLEAQNV